MPRWKLGRCSGALWESGLDLPRRAAANRLATRRSRRRLLAKPKRGDDARLPLNVPRLGWRYDELPARGLQMDEDFKVPFFDPDYCLKVVRWSSTVCVGWLLIELILLATLNPLSKSCPNWTIYPGTPSETHVGLLILLFTAVPTAWVCFIVIRWRRFSEKIFNSILQRPDLITDHPNTVWLVVCLSWTLFCSSPLWFMLSNCTNVFRSLGF
ncbi:hypothetical protein [Nitrobacter sp. JJSN]|uniref:hypothetical protein n=1 Tax=Nitrobacter sp. JJSN TaxID=3453033 RepID=UPI003F769AE1